MKNPLDRTGELTMRQRQFYHRSRMVQETAFTLLICTLPVMACALIAMLVRVV